MIRRAFLRRAALAAAACAFIDVPWPKEPKGRIWKASDAVFFVPEPDFATTPGPMTIHVRFTEFRDRDLQSGSRML